MDNLIQSVVDVAQTLPAIGQVVCEWAFVACAIVLAVAVLGEGRGE